MNTARRSRNQGARLCPPRTSRCGPETSRHPSESAASIAVNLLRLVPRAHSRAPRKILAAREDFGARAVPAHSGSAPATTPENLRTLLRRCRCGRDGRAPWVAAAPLCTTTLQNPREPRRFRRAGGPRPQRLRTCDAARKSPHPGSDVAAAAGTAALQGLRLCRPVFSPAAVATL